MRMTCRSILALTAILVAPAVYAQADGLNPPTGEVPQPSSEVKKANAKEKQKAQLLVLLDHTRALSRWVPNPTSFLAVLDPVQERLAAAKESDLAPLLEFDAYLSELTATLARMDARVSALQSAAELCDPSRKRELFQLHLDALDVDGQGQVQARICEKIAAEGEEEDGSLSQACIAVSLGLIAGQSMHDIVTVCDPSLVRAASGGGFDRLSAELAGVQAGVQESVRASKRELTQAMSMVAGHVAEMSSAQTKQLEDLTVRLEIEKALQQGAPYGSLYLPGSSGGRLEIVRAIVAETIQNVLHSGESANQASGMLAAGDEQFKAGHFKQAFSLYSEAYKAAVAIPSKPR